MIREYYWTGLLFYFGGVAFVVAAEFLIRKSVSRLLVVLVALGLLAYVIISGTGLYVAGSKMLAYIAHRFLAKDWGHISAAVLGLVGASAWLMRLVLRRPAEAEGDGPHRGAALNLGGAALLDSGLAIASMLLVLATGWLLPEQMAKIGTYQRVQLVPPGYVMEEIETFEDPPTRVAIGDDGRIFVAFNRVVVGRTDGGILELIPEDDGRTFRRRVVALNSLLFRPFGLAYHDGALYVSRAGQHAEARNGRITFQSSGAVTELRDLDGDGRFEYANDVVRDLPGGRDEDTQHSNNGVAFGPDGRMYVAVGVGGNRASGTHPLEGKILVVDPATGEVDVFAAGFRNPYALTFGPDGALFVTDNDINENPGDEINHVVRGEHYGHPFVNAAEPDRIAGFRPPIHVGDPLSNLTGLAYGDAPGLPEGLRDRLYVCDSQQGLIYKLELARAGDTFAVADESVFAGGFAATDFAIAPDGSFYCVSYYDNNLVRLRPAAQDGRD